MVVRSLEVKGFRNYEQARLEPCEGVNVFVGPNAQGKTNLVCFRIDGETLDVTSNAENGDMEEKIAVTTEGKDLTIAFNVRYITDVLKALSDDAVVMRFNSNVSPCVVCPTEGESYLYLVLPVRVFGS